MSFIDKIEARARSQAIHVTVDMMEDAFGIRARARTPSARRNKMIRRLKRKFRKMRK